MWSAAAAGDGFWLLIFPDSGDNQRITNNIVSVNRDKAEKDGILPSPPTFAFIIDLKHTKIFAILKVAPK